MSNHIRRMITTVINKVPGWENQVRSAEAEEEAVMLSADVALELEEGEGHRIVPPDVLRRWMVLEQRILEAGKSVEGKIRAWEDIIVDAPDRAAAEAELEQYLDNHDVYTRLETIEDQVIRLRTLIRRQQPPSIVHSLKTSPRESADDNARREREEPTALPVATLVDLVRELRTRSPSRIRVEDTARLPKLELMSFHGEVSEFAA